ncbi:MAG: substrate-binding domain-containing protein [Rikenellaceae bacterium]
MQRIKHIYMLLLASILMVSCESAPERFTIGVSQFSNDNWREQIGREMAQEIPFYEDLSLSFKLANGDNELQREQIEELIDQGVDMLIVIVGVESYITPTIEAAYDRGIKVIIIDNMIGSDKYTAFLGADNVKIGRLAGEYASTSLSDGGRVIELTGNIYSAVAQERHRGFVERVAEAENIEIVESIGGAWNEERAERITDSLLRIHPDIDMIYAHNDAMAYGAYKSTTRLNRDITLIGIDALAGTNKGLDLVSRGAIEVSFLYPTFGNIVMQRAHEILHNEPYERETRFEAALITRNNARVELLKVEQRQELDSRIEELNVSLDTNRRTNRVQRWLLLLSIAGVASATVAIMRVRSLRKKSLRDKKIEPSAANQKVANSSVAPQEVSLNEEQRLLAHFNSYIITHLDDPELGVEQMGREMGYSRAQLHRKIKALTGESPSRLLRNARLQRARELLQSTSKSVSEVGYEVGFTSPSYFTKSYKEYYGSLPSDKML